jgi:cysteinyl-tRNA synthetase, unknown class
MRAGAGISARLIAVAIALMLAATGADAQRLGPPTTTSTPPSAKQLARDAAARRAPLRDVRSWSIQYRRINPFEIAASPFDLVVIDFRPDVLFGTEFAFSRADVAMMQRKPDGGRRLVIAYLSVGEAEDYRWYWQKSWSDTPNTRPAWIGTENARWKGNFPVRFWDPAWPAILFGAPDRYLDRIVEAGFDGVYLDRVDVYAEFLTEQPTADRDMVALVGALSAHARALNPRFMTILQNAEELTVRPPVRAAIDGFAKEDLFYGVDHDGRRNTPDAVAASIKPIRALARAGIRTLLVEYPQDAGAAADIRMRARADGFPLLLADRELASLAPVFPETAGNAPR